MATRAEKTSLAAKLAFTVAIVSGIAAVGAGLITRNEGWHFKAGLMVFRWAAYGGGVAAVLSLIAVLATVRLSFKRGAALAVVALMISGALVAVSWHWMDLSKKVPRIHDISTDTEDPPKLSALLSLRKNASNSAEYGGPDLAAKQHEAYPDIKPLILPVPPSEAFDRALTVGRKMGWKIVDENRSEGRIEAVATTFWFGFKDDVVLRIKRDISGSRLDIRSISRVGISDVGTNAARIRTFLAEMKVSAG